MRDAVGGSFMIKVFIVFLAVYIVFVAIAFNFARAFRVKNEIINIIEQNEGLSATDYTDSSSTKMRKIHDFLGNIGYTTGNTVASSNSHCSGSTYIDNDYEFCIYEFPYDEKKYYKVVTFVSLEIPFFKINVPIPIEGETRMIEEIES